MFMFCVAAVVYVQLDHTSLIYANLIGQLEGTKSLSARLVNLVPLSSGHNLFIVYRLQVSKLMFLRRACCYGMV